jgi:hypothetical protein
MSSPGALPVYRDGRQAAIARLRERIQQIEARAEALSPEDRRALPPGFRDDLAKLAAKVPDPGAELDAIEAAEAAIDAYEDRVEGAVLLATHARVELARTASDRRRRALRIGGAFLVPVAIVAGGALYQLVSNLRERAATAAECRRAEWCRESGRCDAIESPYNSHGWMCGATSDEDCRASLDCAKEGRCNARDGSCAAVSDADCARSQACAKEGRCLAGQRDWSSSCITDSAHCRAIPACAAEGLCTVTVANPYCHAETPADCATSAACRERGACTPREGKCAVTLDGDCERSAVCRDHGACAAMNGACVTLETAACRTRDACPFWGRCTSVDGRCIAGSTAECRDSIACEREGLCTLKDGACAAVSAVDCGKSQACHEEQRCRAFAGRCVQ